MEDRTRVSMVEELSRQLENSVSAVEGQTNQIAKSVTVFEGRTNKMEKHLSCVEGRAGQMEKHLVAGEGRTLRLETEFGGDGQRMDKGYLEKNIATWGGRTTQLERLSAVLEGRVRQMDGWITALQDNYSKKVIQLVELVRVLDLRNATQFAEIHTALQEAADRAVVDVGLSQQKFHEVSLKSDAEQIVVRGLL